MSKHRSNVMSAADRHTHQPIALYSPSTFISVKTFLFKLLFIQAPVLSSSHFPFLSLISSLRLLSYFLPLPLSFFFLPSPFHLSRACPLLPFPFFPLSPFPVPSFSLSLFSLLSFSFPHFSFLALPSPQLPSSSLSSLGDDMGWVWHAGGFAAASSDAYAR